MTTEVPSPARRALLALGAMLGGGAIFGGWRAALAASGPTLAAGQGADAVLDLGRVVSHVTIRSPEGARIAPGWGRAGLEDPTGAHVYRVTSLDDDEAPGTLRHALSRDGANHHPGDPSDGLVSDGPRVVVFDVSGVIALGRNLGVARPRTYVAGQTAPGHVVCRGQSITVRVSDVALRHLSVVPELPSDVEEARNSIGIGVRVWTRAPEERRIVERVWIDHYLVAAWADQAPVANTNHRNEVREVAFTNGVAIEAFKAPDLDPPWDAFEKPGHNLGMLIGQRTFGCVFASNIVAGCVTRTPQAKMATASVVFGNFIHDFGKRGHDMQPAPVQVLTTDDVHDVSLSPIGRQTHLTVVGNYAEPGEQTRAGGDVISGAMVERVFNSRVDHLVRCFQAENRIDPSVVGAVDNPEGLRLGPNGEAIAYRSVGDLRAGHLVLDAPEWWSDIAPTHPGATRAWTLAHAGPRPAQPHALMARALGRLADQAGRDWRAGAREKLYRDAFENPDDDFSAETRGPTPWTPPDDPFGVAPNGLTRIENALNALSDALGGAPWGNVARPLTTQHGGRVEVSRAGSIRWRAPDAPRPPVSLDVTFEDGDALTVSLTTQ